VELSRLDIKNWDRSPESVQKYLCDAFLQVADQVDAVILMDQVDLPETGVVTKKLLSVVGDCVQSRKDFLVVADSRQSLKDYPPVTLKMNRAELAALTGLSGELSLDQVRKSAASLAHSHGRNVFVTLAESGIVGATPNGQVYHAPALPVRGEIDVVGAGDAVTANLTAALASGASVLEALELAMTGASIVVHQLGTTGTASVPQLARLFGMSRE